MVLAYRPWLYGLFPTKLTTAGPNILSHFLLVQAAYKETKINYTDFATKLTTAGPNILSHFLLVLAAYKQTKIKSIWALKLQLSPILGLFACESGPGAQTSHIRAKFPMAPPARARGLQANQESSHSLHSHNSWAQLHKGRMKSSCVQVNNFSPFWPFSPQMLTLTKIMSSNSYGYAEGGGRKKRDTFP